LDDIAVPKKKQEITFLQRVSINYRTDQFLIWCSLRYAKSATLLSH